MPDMDAAGGDGEGARHGAPVLIEEDAARAVFLDIGFAQQVDPAQGGLAIAFQLADDGAGVQMVAAGQAQDLGQHPEMDAVVRVAIEHRVHGAVDVQQHAVVAAPLGQPGVGAEAAGDVVVHDDGGADFLGVFGALVHLLGRGRGDVQIMTLALAGFLLGLVDGVHDEVEALAPAHERLGIDVFVVLGEVETAAQAFVDGATVVLGRQSKLGFDGAAEQRPAVLVHDIALDLDAVRRAVAGHDIGDREAHVFQAQGAHRLEAEHIADQGGEDVDHRAFLEQVDGVGDEGVEGLVVAGHVLDGVGAALVVVEVGQQIGPDRRPGTGGRLGGNGGGSLFAGHAGLRDDLEAGEEIRILRRVIRHPVSLAVFFDARTVSLGH